MTFVHCGTNWSMKQRAKDHSALLSRFSVISANTTSYYIKTPMLPRPRSPLSQTMSTNFCISHPHIRFATSPVIAHIRPLVFLSPLPRLFLFSPNLVTPTRLRLITLPLAETPFHSKSSMQASSQERLRHSIRRQLAKSETALSPQPLYPHCRLTPPCAHTPQMRHWSLHPQTPSH